MMMIDGEARARLQNECIMQVSVNNYLSIMKRWIMLVDVCKLFID